MKFTDFKQAVDKRFNSWKGLPLFVTDTDKQQLWDTYLNSFPDGSNPMYKIRTEHDCNCCKNYIRQMGNVVAIVELVLELIAQNSIYRGQEHKATLDSYLKVKKHMI